MRVPMKRVAVSFDERVAKRGASEVRLSKGESWVSVVSRSCARPVSVGSLGSLFYQCKREGKSSSLSIVNRKRRGFASPQCPQKGSRLVSARSVSECGGNVLFRVLARMRL